MRNNFDLHLSRLHNELVKMGELLEKAISDAANALITNDTNLAKNAIEMEETIDKKEKEIEAECLKLLLLEQPIARDLRFVSAALKMITDMERIGDQAEDVARLVKYIKCDKINGYDTVDKMAKQAVKMVNMSIDSFVKSDIELAKSVISSDDIIDRAFSEVQDELVELIKADSDSGKLALDLLMVAKYLERIGDHTTNIAEWVVYAITGVHESGN